MTKNCGTGIILLTRDHFQFQESKAKPHSPAEQTTVYVAGRQFGYCGLGHQLSGMMEQDPFRVCP